MFSGAERAGAVRAAWAAPKQLLLRSLARVARKPAADVGDGPVAFGAPGLWNSADHSLAAAPGVEDQPQAGGSVDADHGLGSNLPAGLHQPTEPRTPYLSLPAARPGNQRSGPGLVRGCDVPDIFNTDQGSQFTSQAYVNAVEESGAQISMDGKGRCMDNIFVERLWSEGWDQAQGSRFQDL